MNSIEDMRSPVRWLALAITLLSLGSQPVEAQSTGDSLTPETTAGTVQTQEPTQPAEFQGLPRRAPEPRTLHGFAGVFAAFTVAWLGIVAYVLRFGGTLDRIARKMQVAEERGRS